MAPLSFNSLSSVTLTAALVSLTQTGCSTGGTVAATAGAIAFGAGCTYLLLRRGQGRDLTSEPSAVGAPPVLPAVFAARTPAIVSPSPQKTKPIPMPSAERVRELADVFRFTAPYRLQIDLRRYPEGLNLHIGRRQEDGLCWEGGRPVLGLNDLAVSSAHADISLYRTSVRTWGVSVDDRSTNGTQVYGLGRALGNSIQQQLTPDRTEIQMRVGRFELIFKLNDPAPVAYVPPPSDGLALRPAVAKSAVATPPAPLRAILDPGAVRSWAEASVQAGTSVAVTHSSYGVTVHLRPKDPALSGSILVTFPQGTTPQSVKCVCDFLGKHCFAFRPYGLPTMNISLEWYEHSDPYGMILLRGVDARNTVAASAGDRVSGLLTEADLRNVGGLPQVAMGFPFDPEPTRQAIRMVEQIRDAFKRTRDALGHINAPWDAIDRIAGIFGE